MNLEPHIDYAPSVQTESFKIARAASYVRSGHTNFVFFGHPTPDGSVPSAEVSVEGLPFDWAGTLAAGRPGDELRIVWRTSGNRKIMHELDLKFARIPADDPFSDDM